MTRPYIRNQDDYITNRAVELSLATELSESEIASIISDELGEHISRNVIHGRLYRLKTLPQLRDKPRPSMPYFDKYEDYFTKRILPEPKVSFDFSRGHLKILVLNDLHTPFQHSAALEQAIAENRSADVLITSEITDLYSMTSFAKYQHVSFETEVEEIIRLFEFFNDTFPVTYIVSCGHDRRLPRYVMSKIKSELLFLVETDLMGVLARPFPRVVPIPQLWYGINDALFSHLEKHSSTIPMRSVTRTHEWFQNWKPHLNLKPYRLLVQAHSHHSGLVNLPDVQLVESGCLQTIPEWVIRKAPTLPWTWGWVQVYQCDGVTDLNATRVMTYRK